MIKIIIHNETKLANGEILKYINVWYNCKMPNFDFGAMKFKDGIIIEYHKKGTKNITINVLQEGDNKEYNMCGNTFTDRIL